MLPIYFFCVFFCIVSGLLFSRIAEHVFSQKFHVIDDILHNSTFLLSAAIISAVLAVLKIFLPVSKNGSGLFLIGDLFPVLACFMLFCLFAFQFLSEKSTTEKIPQVLRQIHEQSKIIGAVVLVIGVLHLFFPAALLL